jgi:hypothetical protein
VNDSVQVENVEWHPLDVVRWQELNVDLTGIETESEALRRVNEVMGSAVTTAEGRLVAARIIITGTTSLHGSLHRDTQHWRAQLLAGAQDHGAEAIWIERIKITTAPVYNVAELAERDALTKIVVENLDEAHEKLSALPPEVEEMLGVLPPEVRSEVATEWGENQRSAVLNDVRAIILDALGTKGGQSA